MAGKKKKKKKHWRQYISNNLLPARYQLIDLKPLVTKIASVASGKARNPKDIYLRFTRAVGPYMPNNLSQTVKEELLLTQEDIEQQCFLYLMELWDFFTFTWSKRGRKGTTVFYDFARANLSRWIGVYIKNLIVNKNAENITSELYLPDIYEMEDPEIFKLDLNWVTIGSTQGVFANLTVKQKYLLFLRYTEKLSIMEISELIQQHHVLVEREFSKINTTLHGVYNATSTKAQDSK